MSINRGKYETQIEQRRKGGFVGSREQRELDTAKIPRLYKEIKGNNDFLDLLMQTGMMEDEEETANG